MSNCQRNNDKETVPPSKAGPSEDALVAEATEKLAFVAMSHNQNQNDKPPAPPVPPGGEGTKRPLEDPDFWRPPPLKEECPVCLVPLPIDNGMATYWPCCGKTVCKACEEENARGQIILNATFSGKKGDLVCAFCRKSTHYQHSELSRLLEKRINKNDPFAMLTLSSLYEDGRHGCPKDETKALELLHRAADLGCPRAIGRFGFCLLAGDLGAVKNAEKGRALVEDAAKKGDVISRFQLGWVEEDCGNPYLATKHFRLAAAAGEKFSMKHLWTCYSSDLLTKAELEETVRAHELSCKEMSSKERARLEAKEKALKGDDELLKSIYAYYYGGRMSAKDLDLTLKIHQTGNIDQVLTILSKCVAIGTDLSANT
jgi:TPR repeat protein